MIDDRDNALKYLNQELKVGKFDKQALFGAALVYDQLGETGPALEWLRRALQAGYSPDKVRTAPDLDNLKADARFQDLLNSSASVPNPENK
jgi:hypothetical protein